MDLDDDNDDFQSINKFPRTNHAHNGRSLLNQTMDEDKDKSDAKRANTAGNLDLGRFYNWPSSRIVRVSRASGGKDRHSKVLTSKGPRDRRVRLSVNTAIQFYDLQDRLGYDQPSKAVEWLLKAAESSISELPPMPNPFPNTPKCEEKRPSCTTTCNGSSDQLALEDVDPVAREVGDCGGNNNTNNYFLHEQNQKQVAKSCSSASTETSKGSGLSLSRSEIRVKARERAKERVLAEKEKESTCQLSTSLNPISQTMTSSFTELLSSGRNNNNNGSPNSGSNGNISESNFFLKSPRQWSKSTTTTPMDYFTSGLQMHISSNPAIASPMFSVNGPDNHNNGEPLQHFSFVPDHHHLVHAVNSSNNSSTTTHHDQHNNGSLNFTISSLASPNTSFAGINRGTLQSNSSSSSMLLPSSLQLPQRFSNIDNGSPQSFFLAPMDCNSNSNSHYQFLSGYDAARLQLFYGDPNHHGNNSHSSSGRHSKGKGKN